MPDLQDISLLQRASPTPSNNIFSTFTRLAQHKRRVLLQPISGTSLDWSWYSFCIWLIETSECAVFSSWSDKRKDIYDCKRTVLGKSHMWKLPAFRQTVVRCKLQWLQLQARGFHPDLHALLLWSNTGLLSRDTSQYSDNLLIQACMTIWIWKKILIILVKSYEGHTYLSSEEASSRLWQLPQLEPDTRHEH